jgi:hypothetical protein
MSRGSVSNESAIDIWTMKKRSVRLKEMDAVRYGLGGSFRGNVLNCHTLAGMLGVVSPRVRMYRRFWEGGEG